MEVSMSSSALEWSCTIHLRIQYDAYGAELGASNRTSFGPTLTDKGQVELWLRRAQAAILSPHQRPEAFYNKTAKEIQELLKNDSDMLKFSKNVVSVDLKDPDATDLSFVDLPGEIKFFLL